MTYAFISHKFRGQTEKGYLVTSEYSPSFGWGRFVIDPSGFLGILPEHLRGRKVCLNGVLLRHLGPQTRRLKVGDVFEIDGIYAYTVEQVGSKGSDSFLTAGLQWQLDDPDLGKREAEALMRVLRHLASS